MDTKMSDDFNERTGSFGSRSEMLFQYQGHHQEAQTEDAEFQLIWDCRRWLSTWEDYAKSHSLSHEVMP